MPRRVRRDGGRRVERAQLLEYSYKGDDDKEYKQHLLIGYEGAGGGM